MDKGSKKEETGESLERGKESINSRNVSRADHFKKRDEAMAKFEKALLERFLGSKK